MTTVSYADIPDTDDPLGNFIVFLQMFELYKSNYIDFAENLNKYYQKCMTEIDRNKVLLSKPQYNRYIQQCIKKLNKLNVPKFPSKKKLIYSIRPYDDWSEIKEFTIEMLLFFNSNDRLYEDLNFNISNYSNTDREEVNKIWNLQSLIFQASFNLSVNNLKHNLNKKIKSVSNTEYYPEIFKKRVYYEIFKEYINNHIIKPHNDISYIYQKLLSLDYIHRIRQIQFVEWLRSNEFIKGVVADECFEKGGLLSFDKSASKKREKLFEILSEKHLS